MQHRYEFKDKEGGIRVVNLPFTLEVESNWEQIRALTFWTKEPETLYWISDFDSNNVIFWDIGANVGVYSLFCAHAHCFSKIFAFEPHSANFLRLMANVHNNNYGGIIKPQFAAISDKDGYADFHISNAEAGSSGGQLDSIKNSEKYNIQVLSGDTIAEISGLMPTYIKIDVDGDELKILRGMVNALSAVRSILVEANDPDVVEFLKSMNFNIDKKYMALRGAGWKRDSNTNVIFKRG